VACFVSWTVSKEAAHDPDLKDFEPAEGSVIFAVSAISGRKWTCAK
jgi:hypothetical protein